MCKKIYPHFTLTVTTFKEKIEEKVFDFFALRFKRITFFLSFLIKVDFLKIWSMTKKKQKIFLTTFSPFSLIKEKQNNLKKTKKQSSLHLGPPKYD